MIGGVPILKPWTPAEARAMVSEAPDPLKRPNAFHNWLVQICMIYSPLPGDVQVLLKCAYGNSWSSLKEGFTIPPSENGDWRPNDDQLAIGNESLSHWLENRGKEAIMGEARKHSDIGEVARCLQQKEDSIPDFTARYRSKWEEHAGIPLETGPLAVQTLLNCMPPHQAKAYKLAKLNWQNQQWGKVVTSLMNMDRQGLFVSQEESKPDTMGQGGYPQANGRGGGRRRQKWSRDKSQDQCNNCGRKGHWVRECRSGRGQDLRGGEMLPFSFSHPNPSS
ncbi:uncharacterized protein LOC125487974 [Rhincodon typus]|uniref:uncharacterized protein LOC125487974 n=1 Tax=Rhincodon typus TaxID=259920 RepID=UPI00202EF684|nr:uncharacterized protein LOC125487974 [Rhincodon typus]